MKVDEAVEVEEEVLIFSEQFCSDIEREITHGFRYMVQLFGNTLHRCNDTWKLNSINSYRIELMKKLAGNVYDYLFSEELINTQLQEYLKRYFESRSICGALFITCSDSLEWGKHSYNLRTKTLMVCPSPHYQLGIQDFAFSTLDDFIPIMDYIKWNKMIFHLNDLEEGIKTKQLADQYLLDLLRYHVNEEIKTPTTFPAKTINKRIHKILAFNYNRIKDDKLALVLNALIKLKAISPNTTLPQLRALFNGRKITNPIEWLAAQGDLATFVKELIRIMEPEFTSYNQHWNIVGKCFVKKGGIEFDPQQLRNSKPTMLEQKFKEAARKFK